MNDLYVFLLDIDRALFIKINQDWTNPFFDQFFPFITNFKNTYFILLAALMAWVFVQKKLALKIIFGAAIAVGMTDLIASKVIKPIAHRDRPEFSQPVLQVQLRVPHQGSPSFPSNHSANSFAAAAFIGLMVPRARRTVWFLAFLIAYSRVYSGVHFPTDVIGGAILGVLSALTVYRLYGYRIHGQLPVWREPRIKTPRYRRKRGAPKFKNPS